MPKSIPRLAQQAARPPMFTPKPRSSDALTGTRYDRILEIQQRLGGAVGRGVRSILSANPSGRARPFRRVANEHPRLSYG